MHGLDGCIYMFLYFYFPKTSKNGEDKKINLVKTPLCGSLLLFSQLLLSLSRLFIAIQISMIDKKQTITEIEYLDL